MSVLFLSGLEMKPPESIVFGDYYVGTSTCTDPLGNILKEIGKI
jgi:hypothetical protein